ncbi:hypothetical protein LEMLEM_LOCUS24748, partial [Lemmus lemmus]
EKKKRKKSNVKGGGIWQQGEDRSRSHSHPQSPASLPSFQDELMKLSIRPAVCLSTFLEKERKGLSMHPWLSWNWMCRPAWPHRGLPASASRVLVLKACV